MRYTSFDLEDPITARKFYFLLLRDDDRTLLDKIWEVQPLIVIEPEVLFEAGELVSPYGGTQLLIRLSAQADKPLQPTVERCMAQLAELTRGTDLPIPQGYSPPEQYAMYSGFLKLEAPDLTVYSLGCGWVGNVRATYLIALTITELTEEQRLLATNGETGACLVGNENEGHLALFIQPMPLIPDPGIMHHTGSLAELFSLLLMHQFQKTNLGTNT